MKIHSSRLIVMHGAAAGFVGGGVFGGVTERAAVALARRELRRRGFSYVASSRSWRRGADEMRVSTRFIDGGFTLPWSAFLMDLGE